MRIALHDFAGHPFQVQLSRQLAEAGHTVQHFYLRDLPGPKGRLEASPDDPPTFQCSPVSLGVPFEKYSMLKRHFSHRKYARVLAAKIRIFQPDVVLSANTPIDVQHYLLRECRGSGVAFVHWMQDLYCKAVRSLVVRKFGRWGMPLASYYDRLERQVCERSDSVVFITPDFPTAIAEMGFRTSRGHVIENWAPLDDVLTTAKQNRWARKHDLDGKLVFLYSGTLGLKHKPELLYHLAAGLKDFGDAEVVVVSEGLGRERLEQMQEQARLNNLRLMGFQAYAEMSEVLGAADVLLGIIDDEAGVFAVPSKVLSYLCAGRPVLLASPLSNLAARTIGRADAGMVVSPGDTDALIQAARRLAAEPDLRRTFAENARRYASVAFDIHAIATRFEHVLAEAIENTSAKRYGRSYEPAYRGAAAE